ncbi:hypothetical protein EOE18_06210 [Novosphingobium umbonatum]|uniref:Uncharacterized protein n=1 Tax=Novosphingobium umbonatum TaxID=1908524 RepID=A0A3S2UVU9_9SPHN|nr:hypothetical protein [Novosphingobium umbonatum]RVU06407.1 hypothetical protein EOE18_06210 [Novosphingobium umbonatum]
MKDTEQPKYWFPAKRYGWGWGVPLCWQGWTVLTVYTLIVMATPLLPAILSWSGGKGAAVSTITVLIATAALIAICYRKGEPPRWRWGGD